jgi:hypothetical protein
MLANFLQLSFERVFGAVAGLREIAVGAVQHGVGVTVPELALHGVVAALGTFVGFLGTLPAIGIIIKMVADTFGHGRPFEMRVDKNDYRVRVRRKLAAGNVCKHMQVVVIVTMGKFNTQLTDLEPKIEYG